MLSLVEFHFLFCTGERLPGHENTRHKKKDPVMQSFKRISSCGVYKRSTEALCHSAHIPRGFTPGARGPRGQWCLTPQALQALQGFVATILRPGLKSPGTHFFFSRFEAMFVLQQLNTDENSSLVTAESFRVPVSPGRSCWSRWCSTLRCNSSIAHPMPKELLAAAAAGVLRIKH